MERSLEQRYAIKFCGRLGKNATETFQMLQKAFKVDCISRSQSGKWHKAFKEGRGEVADEPRSGRPTTARTDENVDRVLVVLRTDRRLSIQQIADTSHISTFVVHGIVTEDLQMRKVCAKLVPKVLTQGQKELRVLRCHELLDLIQSEPDFLNSVVTGDESWMFEYDPESKRQICAWPTKSSPRPKKARMSKSRIKTMIIVFFDIRGIVHCESVPQGQTVNSAFYLEVLRRLKRRIARVRTDIKDTVKLHHDNATSHTAFIITNFLARSNTPVIPHPPYSPDLAPCDLFLFPRLKREMKGKHWETVENTQHHVTTFLRSIPVEEFQGAFQAWQTRLRNEAQNEDYQLVVSKFQNYFIGKINFIYERAKFNRRVQGDSKPVEEFITNLYVLAENGNYGILKEEMIRDRLVVGVKNFNLSEKLQLESELTLEKAIQIVRQSESVKNQQNEIRQDTENRNVDAIDKKGGRNCTFSQKTRLKGTKTYNSNFPKNHQGWSSNEKRKCFRCGYYQGLSKEQCPAKDVICNKNRKKGHFAKVCHTKTIQEVSSSQDNAFIGIVGKQEKISGAEVPVMPEEIYLQHFGYLKTEKADNNLFAVSKKIGKWNVPGFFGIKKAEILNQNILREIHPIPVVEHTLAQLKGAKLFTKLDANSEFWQIPLSSESSALTTFITPFGRFRFNRLPFVISSALGIFQKRMSQILEGLEGTLCHMDDILVYGSCQEEHDKRLEAVLTRLSKSGLTLNKDKCKFAVTTIKFLGHQIDPNGIQVDPKRKRAIQEFPKPRSVKELKQFLGMGKFSARFVPSSAETFSSAINS
ncbi:hypothetical protein LAZ67_8000653 [Cordylochernes scorpioides]|uniref:Reverse transcriptase domain-containing protein n=1 Tax=Cordylochernes scorpioides TaxID=51811 RepID=A0ABY6KPJ4_9ARAC|nr:hypothetical protein LAZ67_8000653 [Cordylochernes scorpioides]